MSAAAVVRSRYSDRLREALDLRLGEVQNALAAVSHHRQPIGGAGQEGAAWDEYKLAYDRLAERPARELTSLTQEALEAVVVSQEERFATAIRLSADLEHEILAVRSGANRFDATPKDNIDSDGTIHFPKLATTRLMTSALALQGIAAIETGNALGGANMVLDAMQFAQDLMKSKYLLTQLIGSSELIPHSLKVYLESHPLGELDAAALEKLDDGILDLAQGCPAWPEQRGEILTLRSNFERLGVEMSASVLQDALDVIGITEQVGELSQQGTLAAIRRIQAWSEQPGLSELQSHYSRAFLSSAIQLRHNALRLRILHAAIRETRGLEPEPFEDPFDMPLEIEEDGAFRVFVVRSPSEVSAGPVRLRLAR